MQPSQPARKRMFHRQICVARRGPALSERTGILRFRTLQPGIRHYFWPLFFPNQEPGMALIASFGTYFSDLPSDL